MSDLTFDAQIKAVDEAGDGRGRFSAYVSIFGNVDRVGDRVVPGAFAKTLEAWRARGTKIPVIWSHQAQDPLMTIGEADPHKMTEDEKGLHVEDAVLFTDSNDRAAYVHALMKSDVVSQFSFRYVVPRGGTRRAAKGVLELTELELIEIGPCVAGVNPATELVSVKADDDEGEKAGAQFSSASRAQMRAIHDEIVTSLGKLRAMIGDPEETPKTDEAVEAKADGQPETTAPTGSEAEAEPEPEDDRERRARDIERQLQDTALQRAQLHAVQ